MNHFKLFAQAMQAIPYHHSIILKYCICSIYCMSFYFVMSWYSLMTQIILFNLKHTATDCLALALKVTSSAKTRQVMVWDYTLSSNPTRMLQSWRQNMCLYNFLTLSITLSRSCCLLSIKVRAWKVFFFWSGFPGVTPERCSVAVCLWYAKPIYRLRRRTVASHHNSQHRTLPHCVPVLLLPSPPLKPPHFRS